MSPTEREHKLMKEIIPQLKTREAVTPNHKKAKFVDCLAGAPPQLGKVTITDPWLAGIAARVGVGERFEL